MPVGSSSGGSSAAVRAGGAFVELFAKDNVSKTLTKLQSRMAGFGSFMSKIGGGAIKAGSLLMAPLAGLFAGTLEKSKAGVFGPKAQSDAQRFTDAWARAITALQGALVPVLAAITPMLEKLSAATQRNAGVVQIVLGVAAGLIVLGVALKAFGIVLGAVALAVGAVKLVLLAITSPMLLLVGGIAALTAAFVDWGSLFGKLGETGSKTVQGIIDAFQSGDIELAAKIALSGLKLAWHDTVEWMKKQLNTITGAIAKNDLGKIGGALAGGGVGAKVGALFGPWGALIGAGIGGVAGALTGNELDKTIERGGMNFQPNNDRRAQLAAELDELLKQIKPSGWTRTEAIRNGIEAARGAFQSGSFRQALGYGDSVQARQLAAQQAAVGHLANIEQQLGNMPMARFA